MKKQPGWIDYKFCAITDGLALAGIVAIIGWLVVAILVVAGVDV